VTEQEIAEIERVWSAATPGPWDAIGTSDDDHSPDFVTVGRIESSDGRGVIGGGWDENMHPSRANLAAIVAAPAHVAALIAELKRLREAIEALANDIEPPVRAGPIPAEDYELEMIAGRIRALLEGP
jgi:hypothetical protein